MKLVRRASLGAGALLAAFFLVVPAASAQVSDQDTTWMQAAHQSNLAEIAAGTSAQERGASDAVREMGAQLVTDHQTLDANLTAAATELGVELPAEPTPEQQAALQQVEANTGEAYDTAWIASQIDGHRASLAATDQEIASGSDAAVIALAQAARPVIQGHLDHLMQMDAGAPGSVPTGLTPDGSQAAIGASLTVAGALAVAMALLLLARRGRVRA
ncbi:DUF4142 domain-containing protein [Agrococcus sp. DT81.2]|uniref:DUF4142 domain-containing protein n=1 Tax=Agrococcus sp. DT81.2 TaxID=3393414 RepID=UPI003CE51CBE